MTNTEDVLPEEYDRFAKELVYSLCEQLTDCLNRFCSATRLSEKSISEVVLLACVDNFAKAYAHHKHCLPHREDFRERAMEAFADYVLLHLNEFQNNRKGAN